MAAFKRTSELLNIGGRIDLVDGAPSSVTVNLPLSTLDREVFVVTDVQMETESIYAPPAPGNCSLIASINKTKTSFLKINDPNCIAVTSKNIETTALGHIYQEARSPDESSTGVAQDYLTVIATPDFVIAGSLSLGGAPFGNKMVDVRVTGFRAVATADLYAALVTEELNQ
jgi:hypothetical protein